MAGPILFAAVLAVLSFVERDFMGALGWNPLTAATHDWPSGLALGPWGLVMTTTFVVSGLTIVFLAFGLREGFHTVRAASAASVLLSLAGLAMSFLAFPADPTNGRAPPTLHGRIHDAAFVALGVMLVASLLTFGFVFRAERKGRTGMLISWMTAALIVPAFVFKGITFYFFLGAFLAWCEAAALRLLRRVDPPPT